MPHGKLGWSDTICAIIAACNEEETIGNIIRQLYRAGVRIGVLVANGCQDRTIENAKQEAARLFRQFHVENFPNPLGIDVPRAVGAYSALRTRTQTHKLLFVDGDWKGSFGPALEAFIQFAEERESGVTWVGKNKESAHFRSMTKEAARARLDYSTLWETVLAERFPQFADAQPSQLPMLVDRSTFAEVSPFWLYHPGLWFSMVVTRMSMKVAVYPGWDTRLLGNPTRTSTHQRLLDETLLGDAAEGCCLLLNRRLTRYVGGRPQIGYHSYRQIRTLLSWQESLTAKLETD